MKISKDPDVNNNLSHYTTLEKAAKAEIIEKKSRFIGYASPVKTEEAAIDFLNGIRKKHSDATHNVYAYLLREGNITRYSDDGEPSGTAGLPVLDIIRKNNFEDAVIVVTRYFGGTLLGTGGLVRAYSAAAKAAAEAARIVTYKAFSEFELKCGYADYEKVRFELENFGVLIDHTDFSDEVSLKLAVKEEMYEIFVNKLSEMSGGRLKPEKTGSRFDTDTP